MSPFFRPGKPGNSRPQGGKPFKKKFFYKKDEENRDDKPRPAGKVVSSRKEFDKWKENKKGEKRGYQSRQAGDSRFGNKKFERNTYGRGEKTASDLIRLNKYLSNAGVASRREADKLIESGVVTVNGKIITELGFKVSPNDEVKYGGVILRREKPVYILLNKPKDYITTSKDPQERKTVMHLIEGACKERVYPVGRLDRMTTGLLLFTNDGQMAKRLTHPSHGAKKLYHVTLDQNLSLADMKRIAEGIELEDGKAQVDAIEFVEGAGRKEIGIELHSGKNRIVRRIFEHLGYKVLKLDRVVFAGLTKKDLPRGHFRRLSEKEIGMLKMRN